MSGSRRVATYMHEKKLATGLGHDGGRPVEVADKFPCSYCRQMDGGLAIAGTRDVAGRGFEMGTCFQAGNHRHAQAGQQLDVPNVMPG